MAAHELEIQGAQSSHVAELAPATTLRACVAVGAASGALLFYEVAITRILSATLYYHGVFLALAMAMLGVAAPGVWFTTRAPTDRTLPRVLLAAGVTIPASVATIFHVGRLLAIRKDDTQWGLPALSLVCLLVPMLSLGSAICLLLMRAPGRSVGRLYGSDLVGSTIGAVLVIPAMKLVPTPTLVALSGLLPLLAAVLVDRRSGRVAAAIGLALVATAIWGVPYQLRYNRVYVERREPLFERWTPTGRITVVPAGPGGTPMELFGWGWGAKHVPVLREQLLVHQEGGATTPMLRLEGWPTDVSFLLDDVTSIGPQVARARRVCVIGAGGGRDVLAALAAGATDVDAVELNAGIVEAVSERFADFSKNPYGLPGVHGIVSEGRSFLTRSHGEYDAITVSLVDSWAATAAGAYALSENHLYTVEALRLYWSRLSPSGVGSVSRWLTANHQFEVARLSLMAIEALRLEGIAEPRAHLAIVGGGDVASLLLSRTPFVGERLARLEAIAAQRGFRLHWPVGPNSVHSLLASAVALDPPPGAMSGRDLSSATDDRPFFFQSASLFAKSSNVGADFNDRATGMLRTVLALTTALVLALMLAPLAFRRREAVRLTGAGSVYFAAIGLAFMFVELSTIQRFILFLGHPSYATTVVIAALLAGAGLGSMAAERLSRPLVMRLVLAIPIAVALMTAISGLAIERTLGAGFAARVVIAAALLTPTGCFLGLAFPTGMFTFDARARAWHWAVNGAASVLGSVLSLALAMLLGFSVVTWLGVLAYLVALLALMRATRATPALASSAEAATP